MELRKTFQIIKALYRIADKVNNRHLDFDICELPLLRSCLCGS